MFDFLFEIGDGLAAVLTWGWDMEHFRRYVVWNLFVWLLLPLLGLVLGALFGVRFFQFVYRRIVSALRK